MSNFISAAITQVVSQIAAAPAPAPPVPWATRLGQCERPVEATDWLFSCFCLPCASGAAKSMADGTNICHSTLCFSPPSAFSFVRQIYNVKGTCGDDIMCGTFCAPCAVRQMYTEGRIRGPGTAVLPRGGPNDWQESLFGCECCGFFNALLCPCMQAHEVNTYLLPNGHKDSCFSCLCVNPMATYGQVRHSYGIQAEFDCIQDFVLPFVCFPCALNQAAREARWRVRNVPGAVNGIFFPAFAKPPAMAPGHIGGAYPQQQQQPFPQQGYPQPGYLAPQPGYPRQQV